MNRIKQTFLALQEQKKPGLVPYITAGDPQVSVTVPIMHALVEAGADVIELGMPFSDPMAEGPVIQQAHERALANGMTLQRVLEDVAEFRRHNDTTPVILMGYLNPIEIMGYENFAKAAAKAGADGVLIVDMPPEEGDALSALLRQYQLDSIYLVAPTTSVERLAHIKELGTGYHYYVSLKGVTGSNQLNTEEVSKQVAMLRQHLKLPICVGFGINNAQTAKAIAQVADGVVIGSALIEKMQAAGTDQTLLLSEVKQFIHTIREAL